MTDKQRTRKQNKSIHGWCKEMSNIASECGATVNTLVEDFHVDITPEFIKAFWKGACKSKFGHNKTSKLETHQVDMIYDEVNRHFTQKGLPHLPFYSQENKEIL